MYTASKPPLEGLSQLTGPEDESTGVVPGLEGSKLPQLPPVKK